MEAIRVGIVEDEVIIAKTIALYLTNIGYNVVFTVGDYEHAIVKLNEIATDLVLLDINLMAQYSGIDLAKKINEQYAIPFIYLTANCDAATMQKAKLTEPLAFLVKPFKQHDLFSCIEIAMLNYERNRKDSPTKTENLFFKIGDEFKKIPYSEILYLENDQVYINIYLVDGRKEIVRASFADILGKLPAAEFTQISRFHIVHHEYIKNIKTTAVCIGEVELPIRKEKREVLLGRV